MTSMWREDAQYYEQIRDYAIAYTTYVSSGGCTCTFTSDLIDKTIDVVMKLKAHRDEVYEFCGKDIPKYDKEGNRKCRKKSMTSGIRS